jgi:hypothetical protein
MVGSGVYHLMYFNGNVLGISGIYAASVRTVLAWFGGKESPKKEEKEPSGTTNATGDGAGIKGQEKLSEGADSFWKLAFTAGLLSGGLLLSVFRHSLEKKLGIPIFEDAAAIALASSPAAAFLGGILVGVGTKVSPFLDYNSDSDGIVGEWVYFRTHVMRCLTPVTALHHSHGNVLLHCRRSSQTQLCCKCILTNFRNDHNIICRYSYPSITTTPTAAVSLHHPTIFPQAMVQSALLVCYSGTFQFWSRPLRNATTLQNPKLPHPPPLSVIRPISRLRRTRWPHPQPHRLASMDPECCETSLCRQIRLTYEKGSGLEIAGWECVVWTRMGVAGPLSWAWVGGVPFASGGGRVGSD